MENNKELNEMLESAYNEPTSEEIDDMYEQYVEHKWFLIEKIKYDTYKITSSYFDVQPVEFFDKMKAHATKKRLENLGYEQVFKEKRAQKSTGKRI